jgi:5-aminolevulinate synthase
LLTFRSSSSFVRFFFFFSTYYLTTNLIILLIALRLDHHRPQHQPSSPVHLTSHHSTLTPIPNSLSLNNATQNKDIPFTHPTSGDPGKCPHAKAAAQAAAIAASEAQAAKKAGLTKPTSAQKPSTLNTSTKKTFGYSSFYESELEKKHKDKSYRYFNNINRLAAKFPVAHTRETADEVDVWCSNDYLGMSRNGVVLDTMK